MASRTLLIAIVCGLLAAFAFVSPLSLGGLGIVLSTFTALPLFVSALGFGTVAGAISGAVAFAVVAFFFTPFVAFIVAIATLVPALIIGHLAGLMRDDDGVQEWYPLSRIFTVMVLISAAIATAMLGFSGYSAASVEEAALQVMRDFVATMPEENRSGVTDDVLANQARLFAEFMPVIIPASALLVFALNLHLATRIARRAGWMLRPRDHIPSQVALPQAMAALFAAALVLAFLGGSIGLGGRILAGALGMAFLMIGFATLHHLTQPLAARGFLLGMTYGLLFLPLISQLIAFGVLMLGLSETIFGLRARRAVPPPTV
ncbi:MAG: DUF2232 domain-containing protein [Ahrensia sp.]|nr:DUF2232 domain-containing protein [Ahrensia sp.]